MNTFIEKEKYNFLSKRRENIEIAFEKKPNPIYTLQPDWLGLDFKGWLHHLRGGGGGVN